VSVVRIDDPRAYDVIGDVHGCSTELFELIDRLGYRPVGSAQPSITEPVGLEHPDGRRLVFVGDLVDRGPDSVGVLRLLIRNVGRGSAYSVTGNHEDKLLRALSGSRVRVDGVLSETLYQLQAQSSAFRQDVRRFLESLPSHLILDRGRLVVAHAGLPAFMHGQASRASRHHAVHGAPKTGGTDAFGFPVRLDWAAEYRGPVVAYGHTPVVEPVWRNNTVDIDTGCVFGGALTALRWPERTFVSIGARRAYAEKARPWRLVGPGGEIVQDEAQLRLRR
jgi:protein phosphatase